VQHSIVEKDTSGPVILYIKKTRKMKKRRGVEGGRGISENNDGKWKSTGPTGGANLKGKKGGEGG